VPTETRGWKYMKLVDERFTKEKKRKIGDITLLGRERMRMKVVRKWKEARETIYVFNFI
jgi:hypothetical protein